MLKAITTAALASLTQSLSPDGKCRVLALRGGGVHGSFEVGVLKAFVDTLDPEEIAYDYVSGVSVGAINASILALYPPGQEKDAVKELEELYFKYKPQDYWSFWPHYIIEPFYKQSFVDNSDLMDIIDERLGERPYQRKFSW